MSKPKQPSELERAFAFHVKARKFPPPVAEHVFHPHRKWRFDFAWPQFGVAVECEGGIWSGGAHTRAKGFTEDCEKYNEAAARGWLVLRVTKEQIHDGSAVLWLEKTLMRRGWSSP